MSPLDSQPVALAEAVKVLVANALTAAVLFGLSLTDAQVLAVLAVVNSILALATLLIVPQRVSTKRTVANAQKDAYLAGRADEATS